ncbi:Kelch repeat-containing protein 3 [Fusarium poae]|jgi:hypothetical protein|uniref:hypothetical protein n=1 Tax=Fusarium poae TaxID=36050 RepID=UPI001CEA7AC2|nr:hypothetical protein FPOAC1_010858 [Fusarium poae]KAG8666056.1 hypothetical protein FPOAC1_010858 [Fusarium poae]
MYGLKYIDTSTYIQHRITHRYIVIVFRNARGKYALVCPKKPTPNSSTQDPSLNATPHRNSRMIPAHHNIARHHDFQGSSTTPVDGHAAFLPRVQKTRAAALSISQFGDAAMGGYETPPTSTLGSHAQRSASGIVSMTDGMWLPQPHQEVLSEEIISTDSNA